MQRYLVLTALVAGFSVMASSAEAGNRFHPTRFDRSGYSHHGGYTNQRYVPAPRYDYGYDRRPYPTSGYCGVDRQYRSRSRYPGDYSRQFLSYGHDSWNRRYPGVGRSYYDLYRHR